MVAQETGAFVLDAAGQGFLAAAQAAQGGGGVLIHQVHPDAAVKLGPERLQGVNGRAIACHQGVDGAGALQVAREQAAVLEEFGHGV